MRFIFRGLIMMVVLSYNSPAFAQSKQKPKDHRVIYADPNAWGSSSENDRKTQNPKLSSISFNIRKRLKSMFPVPKKKYRTYQCARFY